MPKLPKLHHDLDPGFRALARRFSGGDQHLEQDLLQGAHLRVIEQVARYGARPRTEILRICGTIGRNSMVDFVRKWTNRDPEEGGEAVYDLAGPSVDVVSKISAQGKIEHLLFSLSKHARRLFELTLDPPSDMDEKGRFKLKVSDRAAAAYLGISPATASRARNELRQRAVEIGLHDPTAV